MRFAVVFGLVLVLFCVQYLAERGLDPQLVVGAVAGVLVIGCALTLIEPSRASPTQMSLGWKSKAGLTVGLAGPASMITSAAGWFPNRVGPDHALQSVPERARMVAYLFAFCAACVWLVAWGVTRRRHR